MLSPKRFWQNNELRVQTAIIDGQMAPTIVLQNATYLNSYINQWLKGHIWINQDRIIYVGQHLPKNTDGTELVDCEGYYLVPGYIEPHAHPFQLYHPETLAKYAAAGGTTTLISDNMVFFMQMSDQQAFNIIERLNQLPTTFFWWTRFDSQTVMEADPFTSARVEQWLDHPDVVQGGELTSWPQVLHGNDDILEWMQSSRLRGKPVEGHLPGASERTLTRMELLGVDCDHEAMTGKEAIMRLQLGLTTSLRYSSIRPDLPDILFELIDGGLDYFEHLYMTTDGSTPSFYRQGIMNRLIEIALEQGVPPIEAYKMTSANVARHYGMERVLGHIAPGRLANINVLETPSDPTPVAVLSKGQWVVKDQQVIWPEEKQIMEAALQPLALSWDLTPEQLHPKSSNVIEMVNAVITQYFELEALPDRDHLPEDLSYLSLVDKNGQWKVTTFVKGFSKLVSGFASSYSNTGDIILIGKNTSDMLVAFRRMKAMGGGMVLAEDGHILSQVPLPLAGGMSSLPMEALMQQEEALTEKLRERGYNHADPVYSLLFLSSIHLPYVRITQQGLYDVMNNKILLKAESL
ncbi:adenine deaminase C-terminal domain-containing protein [Tuberibacillus sp. Marseille-P3662]|uniref:adenine deaminase C-terminal domain-containing protein n=1 Tax=Tuberibacillus sp. Marseille-P3662 TaxID=1965358 RepID=UPI0020CB34C8|nr:adenine deaminase C-terminal domain-containing protein [Tuberibacillus sp. Marseille-P3662]